jgi:lysine 2,3-aminomutase
MGKLFEQIKLESPEIAKILSSSKSLEESRKRLYKYFKDLEWEYRNGLKISHKLEYSAALEAIKVFINYISPWNEKICGFSTLEYLWKLARENKEDNINVSIDYVEEIKHLLRAIEGKAEMAKGWLGPILEKENIKVVDFNKVKGENAGKLRSDYLDQIYNKVKKYIDRYPSGLDAKLVAKRKENAKKILDYFGAKTEDWDNYKWHLDHIFKDEEGLRNLKKLVPLTKNDIESIKISIENNIPFGITPYYLSLFDFSRDDRKYDFQVRAQVLPPSSYVNLMKKHCKDRKYYFDFMGESDTSPKKLITRRYPMIAILKPVDTCPQICVYCQRNWEITGPMMPEALCSKDDLDEALEWFRKHPAIIDILITGGDPFILSRDLIKYIMDKLSSMSHIVNVRWASRMPVTLPMRITDELVNLLGSYIEPGKRNISIATHIESVSEITPELASAVMKFRKQGMHVNNQMVLAPYISRRFQNVSARIEMRKVGVHPYYTFYPKGKKEHVDYLIPLARLLQETKEEARLLPGLFRGDEPVFNVPRLGKAHVRAWQDRELIGLNNEGQRIYLWHPWEKGISLVEPFFYKDISIYSYLKKIQSMGENLEEYETIWYYY